MTGFFIGLFLASMSIVVSNAASGTKISNNALIVRESFKIFGMLGVFVSTGYLIQTFFF